MKVIIRESAVAQIEKLHEYISKKSFQNADKVRSDIIFSINRLKKYSSSNPLDKWSKRKNAEIRAFEIHSYRISYEVKKEVVEVLRIRHTKMKPKYL